MPPSLPRRASRWTAGSERRSIYCEYMCHNCSKERATHEFLVRAEQGLVSFVSATVSSCCGVEQQVRRNALLCKGWAAMDPVTT
jgi:hypothetical protein